MAIRTQLRLGQITGSFGDNEGKIIDNLDAVATMAAIPPGSGSMVSVLSQFASSIKRVVGGGSAQSFTGGAASTLKDVNNQTRISYADGAGIIFGAEGDGSTALQIGSSASGDKKATFAGAIQIPDAGTIGVSGVADALTIAANGNVQIKAAKDLLVDEILESTSAAGVTIDGVLIKDNDILFPGDASTIGSNTTNDLLTLNANDVQVKSGKDLLVDEILESTADAGVTIDGVTLKDDDIVLKNGKTIGSATTPGAITIAANGDITLAAGLTVAGTTTTVNSDNTVLKDRILTIASGSSVADVDSGIIFARSSADLGGGNRKNGALQFDGASGNIFKLGATDNKGEDNTIDVADADLGDLYVGKLLVDGSGNHVDVTSSDLTLTSAANLHLDSGAHIELDAAANQTIKMMLNGTDLMLVGESANPWVDGAPSTKVAEIRSSTKDRPIGFKQGPNSVLVMSSSAEYGLLLSASATSEAPGNFTFDANGGKIRFTNPAQTEDGFAMGFDVSTDQVAKFLFSDDSTAFQLQTANDIALYETDIRLDAARKIEFRDNASYIHQSADDGILDIVSDAGVEIVSNYLKIGDGTSNVGKIQLMESHAGQDGSVSIDVPSEVAAGHITITLPSTVGNSGDVLQSDGSGNLSFVAQGGAANSSKTVQVLTAGINAAASAKGAGAGFSGINTQALLDAQLSNNLDVFVNGQLLQSSSVAFGSLTAASAGDYSMQSGASADFKFTFALEKEDTVTVVVRA